MMTLDGVTKKKPAQESADEQAAAELVRLAQEEGLALTGPNGLLKQLTKTVLEPISNDEMTEHLDYEKHDSGWSAREAFFDEFDGTLRPTRVSIASFASPLQLSVGPFAVYLTVSHDGPLRSNHRGGQRISSAVSDERGG